jgi:hypothetical protein
MFMSLSTTPIRKDCLRGLCLEFWEAFVNGVRDDGKLRHLFRHIVAHCLNHSQEYLKKTG